MVYIFSVPIILHTSVKDRSMNWLPLSNNTAFGGPKLNTQWCTKVCAAAVAVIRFSGIVRVNFLYLSVINKRIQCPLFVRVNSPSISIATDASDSVALNCFM